MTEANKEELKPWDGGTFNTRWVGPSHLSEAKTLHLEFLYEGVSTREDIQISGPLAPKLAERLRDTLNEAWNRRTLPESGEVVELRETWKRTKAFYDWLEFDWSPSLDPKGEAMEAFMGFMDGTKVSNKAQAPETEKEPK